jgi:hypothetical protein
MTCLVLGNGKSLENFKFQKIYQRYDAWVGCCLAFRRWNEINIHPTFYVNVDRVVCEKNPEVKEYVKQGKCKKYLLSETIKNIWHDYPKDGSIVFMEDILRNTDSIFKLANNYCSGSSAVLFALDHFDNVDIAGFDCDYVEFIPECEKLPDGSLRITKTPEYNPNYFFNDYQRKGDIYNVPNGKRVHLRSWFELSKILEFIKVVHDLGKGKSVTNFNNKKSISEFITTLPLDNLLSDNKENVAFLVPSTSNKRDWKNFRETYLNQILLPSITTLSKSYNITVYVGYDEDDKLYSNINLPETYDDISQGHASLNLKWIKFEDTFKGKPTHIWNCLAQTCINDGFEYFQVCGDDIRFDPNPNWLRVFIDKLKEKNNIGYSAGYSNNHAIPTQFLFHKKHCNIFGWVFPPQITDWQCDDFIYHLYGKKGQSGWLKQFNHYNVGGEPRYTPTNPVKLREMLVKRNKKILNKFI